MKMEEFQKNLNDMGIASKISQKHGKASHKYDQISFHLVEKQKEDVFSDEPIIVVDFKEDVSFSIKSESSQWESLKTFSQKDLESFKMGMKVNGASAKDIGCATGMDLLNEARTESRQCAEEDFLEMLQKKWDVPVGHLGVEIALTRYRLEALEITESQAAEEFSTMLDQSLDRNGLMRMTAG